MIERAAKRVGVTFDDEAREAVTSEQLKMVWSHAAVSTIVSTTFAVVMAIYFAHVYDRAFVQGWIVLKVLVAAPRAVQAQVFRRRGYPGGSRWMRATCGMLFLDGAVWGFAGFFLMSADLVTAAMAVASFCGIACVASFGLQASKLATAAYVVPIMVGMIVGLLFRSDGLSGFGLYVAIGLTFFLGQVLVTSSRVDLKLAESFLLRVHSARVSEERTRALELVERQSAIKSQFLGTVSHELRTPIHGMLGIARLVHLSSSDDLVKKRMSLMEASGTHLLGLVTDLIEVSKVASGQLKISNVVFDLSSEIDHIAEAYAIRASEKHLTFSLDLDLPRPSLVLGDPMRTRQVLHNLIGNAIKFTDTGWVGLVVREGDRRGLVVFAVRDTGVGISDEEQGNVFEAFTQGGSHEGRQQGTGLGLTIAREIARLLGGDITVESRLGFGSIFTLTIQFASATPQIEQGARAEDVSEEVVDTSTRILVVEDNDVNFLVVSSMLTNQGHLVERATDGLEGVRNAMRESARPQLVLMDCMMPHMDGFEATREIRRQEAVSRLERVPIIALTALVDELVDERARDAGMNATLGKPFSNDDLRSVIRPWLAKAANPKLANDVGRTST